MKTPKSNNDIDACFTKANAALELNDMSIRSLDLGDIAKKMLKKTETKELHLSKNKLGTPELRVLCEAIAGLPQLEVLNLSKNHLSVGVIAYVNEILKKASKLKELNLAHNLLNLTNKDIDNFINFTKIIAEHSALESLNISSNNLNNDKLTIPLIKAIYNHPTLKSLNLSGNCLGQYEAQLLGKMIANNQKLTSLSLAYNQDESSKPLNFYGRKYAISIEPILSALKENCSLIRLDLRGIQLRISELELLKSVLENNSTLTCVEWDIKSYQGEEELQERATQLGRDIQAALEKNAALQPKGNIFLQKTEEVNIRRTP